MSRTLRCNNSEFRKEQIGLNTSVERPAFSNPPLNEAAVMQVGLAKTKLVPEARFAPFAPRNSHSQLRHDIHFGAMYEFSVPQPIALFAYGLPRCGAEAQDDAATRIANMAFAVRGSQKLIEITRAESRHTANARPGEEKKYRQKCAALCRAR
jgi:hypothetical protein